ncbi:MAG: hypothetical protein KF703_14965 [Actinobacteria bacterium]|nr:hypothetical protein [Actinomycetota bacterium]
MTLQTAPSAAPGDRVEIDPVRPGDGAEPRTHPGPVDDPARPERSLARRLRLPVLVTLLLQIAMAAGDQLPSVDGTAYFETGRNLLNGNGFTRQGGPELHFPPLTPLGFAGLEKLTGSEMAALRIWNFGSAVLVVGLLVALAHRLWRDDTTTVATAWLAGTVAGLTPLFTRQGGGSESISLAMLLAAALAAITALHPHTSERRRLLGLAGAGLAVGLAYLSRPESLLPGGFVGLGIVVVALRRPAPASLRARRVITWSAAFGLALAVLVAPYLGYLHGHTGKWSPTAKSQDASIEAWRAVAENNRLQRDRILYAIDDTGTGLGVPTRSLTALAKDDPGGWLGIVWVNLTTLFKLFVTPVFEFGPTWRLIPGFLLVPAFLEMWRSRRSRATQLLVAMGFAPMLTCIVFFTLPRYLVATTAVITLFAARGLVELTRRWSPRTGRILVVATAVLVATSTLGQIKPLLPWTETMDPTEQAAAGRWLAANTPADARIMTRSFHVQAYAHRPVVAMPSADYFTTLEFARRMGVTYVVADPVTLGRRRPELYPVLMGDWMPPPGLKLVKTIFERGEEVRIFQLDPVPPPSDQDPIPLGYVSD